METFTTSSSGVVSIRKDVKEVLDYTFNWQDYLVPIGDFINGPLTEFLLDPDPNETGIVVDSHIVAGYKVAVSVSGGVKGTTYRLGCKITTLSVPPREAVRSIYLKIVDR